MPTRVQRVDVVVIGAGTAGANVAGQFARRGRSVALVERRPGEEAGAQWHNGVLPWQFESAGVDPPVPGDAPSRSSAVAHFFGPDGRHGLTLTDSPVVRADMAALGRLLRSTARDAGAELFDSAELTAVDTDRAGRIRAVDIDIDGRRGGASVRDSLRLEADLFVDASGRQGALRGASPALGAWCPEIRGDELCSAGDHELTIDDTDGAWRFLTKHGAEPGQSVTVLGPAGGWSTRVVTVAEDLATATMLVGCIASGPNRTAPRMHAEARADLAWLGEVRSGAFGVIPLRRTFARFTAPGLALVGDAASQVFPAHGSGIGVGLMAGTMLAESVAGADDCGSESTLWNYQREFQRRHGGTLAAYEGVRRMSTELGTAGVARMIGAGLLGAELTRAGLDQRWSVPRPLAAITTAGRLVRVPSVAATMLPRLARAQRLSRIGTSYPDAPDLAALERWDRSVRRLLGALPAP